MNDTTCPVCKVDLSIGAHDLAKHREAMIAKVNDQQWGPDAKERAAARDRHPAGSRLPGAHRNGE